MAYLNPTTNIGLVKPEPGTGEKIRLTDINGNMDKIDAAVGAVPSGTTLQDEISGLSTDLSAKAKVIHCTSTDNTWSKIWTKINALATGETATIYFHNTAYSAFSNNARTTGYPCGTITKLNTNTDFGLLLKTVFNETISVYVTGSSSSSQGTYSEKIATNASPYITATTLSDFQTAILATAGSMQDQQTVVGYCFPNFTDVHGFDGSPGAITISRRQNGYYIIHCLLGRRDVVGYYYNSTWQWQYYTKDIYIGTVTGSTGEEFMAALATSLNDSYPLPNLSIGTVISGSVTWSGSGYCSFTATRVNSFVLMFVQSYSELYTARVNPHSLDVDLVDHFVPSRIFGDLTKTLATVLTENWQTKIENGRQYPTVVTVQADNTNYYGHLSRYSTKYGSGVLTRYDGKAYACFMNNGTVSVKGFIQNGFDVTTAVENTQTDWFYTGASYTIPANSVYSITAYAIYNVGAPIGIKISVASDALRNYQVYASNEEGARATLSGKTGSDPLTLYAWAKYAAAGRSNVGFTGFTMPA